MTGHFGMRVQCPVSCLPAQTPRVKRELSAPWKSSKDKLAHYSKMRLI